MCKEKVKGVATAEVSSAYHCLLVEIWLVHGSNSFVGGRHTDTVHCYYMCWFHVVWIVPDPIYHTLDQLNL